MKKKFLAMVSATLLMLSSFTSWVSATEISKNTDTNSSSAASLKNAYSVTTTFSFKDIYNTDTANTADNALITRNPDGTFSRTVYDFSAISQAINQKTNLNTEPYLPTPASSSSETTVLTSTTDQYGRESNDPTDPRVGHLLANYDTDGDGDIDRSFYGTASLQAQDLLISCAHIVWKPEYSDLNTQGWASKVVFYAGRSASREYAASEICTFTSIPQNYVSLSSHSIDANGNTVTYTDKNWDWSILRVSVNLGSRFGWLGLHGCGEPENGIDIKTVGYPGDKTFGSQWTSYGTITGFTSSHMMYFDAYCYDGNSGGPIIDDNGYVYGIAAFITYTQNALSQKQWVSSGGVRMYDELFGLIVAEKEAAAERWE